MRCCTRCWQTSSSHRSSLGGVEGTESLSLQSATSGEGRGTEEVQCRAASASRRVEEGGGGYPDSPEFARDPEILAAPHEGVALAALGRGRDTGGAKVLLLPSRDRDESTETHESVLPRDDLCPDVGRSSWCQPPASRPKGLVQDPSIFDLGEVDETVWSEFLARQGRVGNCASCAAVGHVGERGFVLRY